jgi:hypothetical protein
MNQPRSFEVTRKPRYDGEDSLHGGKQYAPDDFLILIDGEPVGGTYWGGASDGPGHWHSWGPAGYSLGHMSREDAERAQVREYAINPSLIDRINADADREQEEAERQRAAEAETQDRIRRLGDDEPGPVIWSLPACHVLYAPMGEVEAVGAWLAGEGIDNLVNWHDAHLERRTDRMALVYEAETAMAALGHMMGRRSAFTSATETRAVTVTTEPPRITVPPRPDLLPVFTEHYPGKFPLVDFGLNTVCTGCTHAAEAVTADQMVRWPCAVVEAAVSNRPAVSA